MARLKDKIKTPKVILVKKEDDLEVIINYLKNKEEVIVNVSLISFFQVEKYMIVISLIILQFLFELILFSHLTHI